MLSETKIDDSFPIGHFLIHGFSSTDHDSKDDGIMLHIREDILSNLLTTEKEPIESPYVE